VLVHIRQLLKENSPLVYVLLGLVSGSVVWFGVSFWPKHDPWSAAAILAVISAVVVMALTLMLTIGPGFTRQLGVLTLLLGGAFALVSVWLIVQLPDPSLSANRGGNVLTVSWSLSSIVLTYILLPFIQAWPGRHQGRYRYRDLYCHSWDNFFILLVAGMLTLAYWLLMVLWVMLFKMVGISLFETLFFNVFFPCLSLPVVFSLGIRLARSHEKIIGALRNIAQSLCFFLMPLTALITLIFAASLPFTGLQPVWDTGYSTPILLCLIGANLLFVNGIFQDGETRPYRSTLAHLTEVALLVLPVYAVIGVYSVYLRIDQYGVTPNRFFLMVLVIVASCYSFVYALAVLRRTPVWLGAIRQGNQMIALLICLLILLIHSPLLNPLAWSARDQLNRLLSEKISAQDFDFGALKFHFGSPGLNALQHLRQLPEHEPLAESLQTWLTAVDEATSYYQWKNHKQSDGISDQPMVEFIEGNGSVPDGFLQLLGENQCRKNICYLLAADFDHDGVDELLFFDMDDRWVAPDLYDQQDDGLWKREGTVGQGLNKERRHELIDRLKQQHYRLVAPPYQALQVGEAVYLFER
jgi:hypothetical protein